MSAEQGISVHGHSMESRAEIDISVLSGYLDTIRIVIWQVSNKHFLIHCFQILISINAIIIIMNTMSAKKCSWAEML